MRKQGVRLLGPENGEAIWVGCPSPEGTVQCSRPPNWARGTIGGGSGGPAGPRRWGLEQTPEMSVARPGVSGQDAVAGYGGRGQVL